MLLTLQQLKEKGGLVSDELVQKTITFRIDHEELTADILVLHMSISDQERMYRAAEKDGEGDRVARMIAGCVFLGEDGRERIPFADAQRLHPSLATAMAQAVNEVNGLTERKN